MATHTCKFKLINAEPDEHGNCTSTQQLLTFNCSLTEEIWTLQDLLDYLTEHNIDPKRVILPLGTHPFPVERK